MGRKISIASVVISFLVMGIWDIYPTLTPETGDTISEATRDFGTAFYVLPYICGIVMGHFFINGRSTRSITNLWVSAAAVLMRDTVQLATFPGGNALALLLGAAAGAYWWPQATVAPEPNIQDNLEGKQDADPQE